MKLKKLITMSAAAFTICQAASAQTINKTYGAGKHTDLYPRCVLTLPDTSGSIIWSASVYTPSEKFLLAKTNALGVLQKSIYVDTATHDHRILATYDTGVLLACYSGSNVFVFKYTGNLVRQWGTGVPVGNAHSIFASNTVDIEQGFEDSTGQDIDSVNDVKYYILSAAATYHSSFITKDVAFTVIKLNKNGQLVWHRIYADPNRSSLPETNILDIPRSITAVDSNFVIAGTRREVYDTGVAQYLYYITIDRNGNIINQYERVRTADEEPWDPEVAWDPYNRVLASTYTETNNTFSGFAGNERGIGFLGLDTNLNVLAGRYYWDSCSSYGNSITVSGDSAYIIGSSVITCGASAHANPALLKIDAASYTPIFYKRYNINKDVLNESFHITDAAGSNYMVPRVAPDVLHSNTRTRLIKTNALGNSCGSMTKTINELEFEPAQRSFNYASVTRTNYFYFNSGDPQTSLSTDSCSEESGNNYRLAPVMEIKVYPTLADPSVQELNCSLRMQQPGMVTLAVYNTLGQQLLTQQYQLQEGYHLLHIPADKLGSGMNMIVVSRDRQVIHTAKVIRQ